MTRRPSSDDDLTEQLPDRAQTPRPPSDRTHGRFSPGEIFAGRYRIISRIGAGGMGEVYRADDIRLNQSVALKFLPPELQNDRDLIDHLHSEVRVGRTISHPNVCRLYDIGEADGQTFIAMEYVAGEDLATLLRRIGRLPHDKAVAVATQLGAGLAAAHAKGILHRDLKPANVMLDEHGDVRITDFGLAAEITRQPEAGMLIGTPAYMAPEQLEGKAATVQSDLFALGLVLFELFTGRKALSAQSIHELMEEHRSGAIRTPSSVVRDIDPVVERVIVRCLDRDPAQRPRSAREVVAALPGGDPLAAAIAAGETPSPELVAAAGVEGSLRPPVAWALLLAGIILALVASAAARRNILFYRMNVRNPEVMRDAASHLVTRYGHDRDQSVIADRFIWNVPAVSYYSSGDPAWWRDEELRDRVLEFWWVQAPAGSGRNDFDQLLPETGDYSPPPGATFLRFDASGTLLEYRHVSERLETPHRASDFNDLFRAAGADVSTIQARKPELIPTTNIQQQVAWNARTRDRSGFFEGGSVRGAPSWFIARDPWMTARTEELAIPFRNAAFDIASSLLLLVLLSVALLIARKNVKQGRADLRGTVRLGAFTFCAALLSYLLQANHSVVARSELGIVMRAISYALAIAAALVVLYLGIEPIIRRRWPERLVSWTRLLSAQWRDPLVGRDVLIGTVAGLLHAAVAAMVGMTVVSGGLEAGVVSLPSTMVSALSAIPDALVSGISVGLGATMLLVAAFIFTRRKSVAIAVVYFLLLGLFLAAFSGNRLQWALAPFVATLFVAVVSIAGPIGFALTQGTFLLFFHWPVVPTTAWYGRFGLIAWLWAGTLLMYGFVVSLGSRRALQFRLLDDE